MASTTVRKLRKIERKSYADAKGDEEIEGRWTFSVEEKLQSGKYNANFVQEMTGDELDVTYWQHHGFSAPILVRHKHGLGVRVPEESFGVADVRRLVGARRTIDVMDARTQEALTMTMHEWNKYYDSPRRDRTLNVLSLEFSHSRLQHLVEQPNVVKAVDWVDTAWPRHLKQRQTDTTNNMTTMQYPKVQKYCLMSVAGCYTDFHIDMGGTSVWYHVLRGAKTFWLIPPTEENLALYEEWTLGMKQEDEFLADRVQHCQRLRLQPGDTFFIPSGWIHAVHTPEDSLVFGGNFLHSFGIAMQLRIWGMEAATHVPMKFRYPFFTEIHWYVLERYVAALTGTCHRVLPHRTQEEQAARRRLDKHTVQEQLARRRQRVKSQLCDLARHNLCHVTTTCSDMSPLSVLEADDTQASDSSADCRRVERRRSSGGSSASSEGSLSESEAPQPFLSHGSQQCEQLSQAPAQVDTKELLAEHSAPVNISAVELAGISQIIKFLDGLNHAKRCVPEDIPDPDTLLAQAKALVVALEGRPFSAVPGHYLLSSSPRAAGGVKMVTNQTFSRTQGHEACNMSCTCAASADGGICHECRQAQDGARCRKCDECRLTQGAEMGNCSPSATIRCASRHKPKKSKMKKSRVVRSIELRKGVKWFLRSHETRKKKVSLQNKNAVSRHKPTIKPTVKCKRSSKWPDSRRTDRAVRQGGHFSTDRVLRQGGHFSALAAGPVCVSMEHRAMRTALGLSSGVTQLSSRLLAASLYPLPALRIRQAPTDHDYSLKSFLTPVLRALAACGVCGRSVREDVERGMDGDQQPLMECHRCRSILHPHCFKRRWPEVRVSGEVSDGLPHTWLCPRCVTARRRKRLGVGRRRRHSEEDAGSSSGPSDDSDSEVTFPLLWTKESSSGEWRTGVSSPGENLHDEPAVKRVCVSWWPRDNPEVDIIRRRVRRRTQSSSSSTEERGGVCSAADGQEVTCGSEDSSGESPRMRRWLMRHQGASSGEHVPSGVGNRRLSTSSADSQHAASSYSLAGVPHHVAATQQCYVLIEHSTQLRQALSAAQHMPPADHTPHVDPPPCQERQGIPRPQPATATYRHLFDHMASRSRDLDSWSHDQEPVTSELNVGDMNLQTLADASDFEPQVTESDENDESPANSEGTQSVASTSASSDSVAACRHSGHIGQGEWDGGGGGQICENQFPADGSANQLKTPQSGCRKRKEKCSKETLGYKPRIALTQKREILWAALARCLPLEGRRKRAWLSVFSWLDTASLLACSQVCKTWYRWCLHHSLWTTMAFPNTPLTEAHLLAIVQRQPVSLDLSWSNISYRKLEWLLQRLPLLRQLDLSGCSWAGVCALCSPSCPQLHSLNLSWVSGLITACLRDLVAPPEQLQPGVGVQEAHCVSRLHDCHTLNLSGANISTAALPVLAHHLPSLATLRLDFCVRLTDDSIATLACTMPRLRLLSLSRCHGLTNHVFAHLCKLRDLEVLHLNNCSKISQAAVHDFVASIEGTILESCDRIIFQKRHAHGPMVL